MKFNEQIKMFGLEIVEVNRPLNFTERFAMFSLPNWMFRQTFYGITKKD